MKSGSYLIARTIKAGSTTSTPSKPNCGKRTASQRKAVQHDCHGWSVHHDWLVCLGFRHLQGRANYCRRHSFNERREAMSHRKELTPWLPGDVAPVREGVYLRINPQGHEAYSKWNGRFWCCFAVDLKVAQGFTAESSYQNWQWRGVAENPSATPPQQTEPPAQAREPLTFEEWLSKQHGDPEEIGFLRALRIAYIAGQDSIKKSSN